MADKKMDPFFIDLSQLKKDCVGRFGERHVQEMDRREAQVHELGVEIGFGRLMQLSSSEWRKALPEKQKGSEQVPGPHSSETVKCGCAYTPMADVPGSCNWCAGSGWLTKYVRKIQLTGKVS